MSDIATNKSTNQLNAPKFFYGTAWKEERTEALTLSALNAGFFAIDTANQRKHYYEDGVGKAIQTFVEQTQYNRSDLFIQTKYTYQNGQDHRLPYEPTADYKTQVLQSFSSSLKHLRTDYVDSYILHGPFSNNTHNPEDYAVWQAMEELYDQGLVKQIGVSNVTYAQLQNIYGFAKVKPTFVQNRCYARMGWDKEVRFFCQDNKISYQGFSLLTANKDELGRPLLQQLSEKYNKSIPQITFKFAQQLGMITLTGTTNPDHMVLDLKINDFELTPEEILQIEHLSF